ncbi:MAG: TonB-dependent receptor [Chitinophagaceae bacterium]|nr:TonB-dependent receptor [Chitinophagaceae bacterium]
MKWALAFFMLVSLNLPAQKKELELDPVTLVSSLNVQKVSQTGRNIIVIPGEQFSKLPVHSVDELLRYVPGIEIQSRGPEGSQSDIVLRGGTFQQVLVMLDGIRLNDPNTGHFSAYIPIAPAEIDHIEILKGASSAIYGSDAVGGVISIVTKTFAGKKIQDAGKNIQVAAEGIMGEYRLINGNAGGFYQDNSTSIGGGLLSNNSHGQLQRGTRGFFHNNTASLSWKQWINEHWNIALRSAYDSRDFSAQNFYTTFASDTASEKVETVWNQFRVQYQKNKHIVVIDAGYKSVKDHFAFNPSSAANENHSYLFQTSVTDNYHVLANANLVSGIQYQQKWIRSNDRGNHNLAQEAAFLIWNQNVDLFTYSPSLRFNHFENGGTELIPQLNLSYHLSRLQIRASIGKTIREADFTERYNNYNKSFVSGGSIGNPYLKPERSLSYEAGVDYLTTLQPLTGAEGQGQLKISATVFKRNQRNIIDWVTTPYSAMPRKDNLSPSGTYALASNIATVNTTGVETDVQYLKRLDRQRQLRGAAGFTWLDDESNETTPSFYILSHAKFLTNFNLEYSGRFFSMTVDGVYKHRAPQKASAINAWISADYFIMNFKFSVSLQGKRLKVFTELDNVFNTSAGDLLGSKLPGRWWMGGISVNFSNKK